MGERMSAADLLAMQAKPRANKYGAVRTTVDGITFDSKGEADRWCDLRNLQRARQITGLRRQVRYALSPHGYHVCDYIADFVYDVPGQGRVVEDFKGHRTSEYITKAKLFRAVHGFDILETGRARSIQA